MAGKIRLGVAGCGPRGAYIGGLFKDHPECELTAVMDKFLPPAQKAAEAFHLPEARVFTDFDKMLRDAPMDAIYLACDPMVQVDMACRAMAAGKHVCTDVPAAFSIDECWDLVRTVEKTGRKYMLMEQVRYSGFVETWKRMRERGEFGHVCFAQGEYIHYLDNCNFWIDPATGENICKPARPTDRTVIPSWRLKAFAHPIYYLPHTLSPLLYILGDRVERVSCMGTQQISYAFPGIKLPARDIEYALMHTAGDTVLAAGAGFTFPYPHRHAETGHHWYELRGTRASVESPRRPDDRFWRWRESASAHEAMDLHSSPQDATAEQLKTGHGGRDFKPVDLFVTCVLNDTLPAMDVYLAVETAAPAILAAESARRDGVMLTVPDFRPGARPA